MRWKRVDATQPPEASKISRVVSWLSSEQSQQTIGAMKSGEKALTISSGQIVAVMAVPAFGTMADGQREQ